MIRWSIGFGLVGFLTAIGVAFGGEAPLEPVLWSALVWGATFTLLGFFIARVVSILLAEAGIPEAVLAPAHTRTHDSRDRTHDPSASDPPGVGPGEGAGTGFSSGSPGSVPITDDEGSAPGLTPDRTPRTSSEGSIGGMGGNSNEDPNPEDR